MLTHKSKVLCIPHGDERTEWLRKTYKSPPPPQKKNNGRNHIEKLNAIHVTIHVQIQTNSEITTKQDGKTLKTS
jgi:hypothetical protein